MENLLDKVYDITQYAIEDVLNDETTVVTAPKHTVINGVKVYTSTDHFDSADDLKRSEYMSIEYAGYDVTFHKGSLVSVKYLANSKTWFVALDALLADALQAIMGGRPTKRFYEIDMPAVETVTKTVTVNNPSHQKRIVELEAQIEVYKSLMPSTARVTYESEA